MSERNSPPDTGSGYPSEHPDPHRRHPQGPGEGKPHEHQNDPGPKPSSDPHKTGAD